MSHDNRSIKGSLGKAPVDPMEDSFVSVKLTPSSKKVYKLRLNVVEAPIVPRKVTIELIHASDTIINVPVRLIKKEDTKE